MLLGTMSFYSVLFFSISFSVMSRFTDLESGRLLTKFFNIFGQRIVSKSSIYPSP